MVEHTPIPATLVTVIPMVRRRERRVLNAGQLTACLGCDFNSYRQGNTTFYGPGADFTVDTSKPFTVVTQFLTGDDGSLADIKRFYVQDGVVIENSESLIEGAPGNSVTQEYCDLQKSVFGDQGSFNDKGGLAQMGEALAAPMVLVLSLWDDVSVTPISRTPEYLTLSDR